MAKKVNVSLLRQLRELGYSYRHIAYLTGISYTTVVNYLKDYQVKNKFRTVDAELEEKILEAYEKNKSITMIAAVFNVRASDVINILKKNRALVGV